MPAATHVFAVAVEKYQDPAIPPVPFAENDAKAIVAAWQALGADPAHCVLLANAAATHTAILSRLRTFLAQVGAGDRIVLYYAGHGGDCDGHSYVAAHDTQPGDLQRTCIPLAGILGPIREGHGRQTLLFFDASHGGLPPVPGMRALDSGFSARELEEFCRGSESHAGFAACQAGQASFSSHTLRHGIWSHCLLQALRGEAPAALEKGHLVTGASLQNHLADEVPKVIQREVKGTAAQTPRRFGNLTNEFLVADVTPLLDARISAANQMAPFVKDAHFLGEKSDKLRSLSEYKKPRFPMKGPSADRLVKTMGRQEVTAHATAIRDALKREFGYKFNQLAFADADGDASIKTPEFDVDVSIASDPEDSECYRLTTTVNTFRDRAVVQTESFSDALSPYCTVIRIEASVPIRVHDLISKIEDDPKLKDHLDYPPGGEHLTLRLASRGIRLHVDDGKIEIHRSAGGTIAEQLTAVDSLLSSLTASGIALLPR